MSWIDTDGDKGIYTGEVNGSSVPDGIGQMNYDDGPVVEGRWKEGEMVIEGEDDYTLQGEDDTNGNMQQLSNINQVSEGGDFVEEIKKRQLQEFHERNQYFLKSQNQYNEQQPTQEEIHQAKIQQLHEQIHILHQQVSELTHELRNTQESSQLTKDQSSAEIIMLQTELERQNSRYGHIASSLRNRLVESEMARIKIQDHLSSRMEVDARREDELKVQWNELTNRVIEDKEWVDEQMGYWKESMEEHRRRLSTSKTRGGLGAELAGSGPGERKRNESSRAEDRRTCQRKLWGAISDSDGSDDEDEEEMRMFGARDTSTRHSSNSSRR